MPELRIINPRLISSFIFAVFLVLFSKPLFPYENCLPANCSSNLDKIVNIEITGLRRTRPHVARYHLDKFLGQERTALDFDEVQAAVRETGVLEPVKEELIETENGLILRVTVRERWTIFPAPVVMGGIDDFRIGLVFLDTNAFGLRNNMVAGAMYETSGWMLMGMYQFMPVRSGLPVWNTIFRYDRRERQDLDRYETVHRRYDINRLRFSLGLTHSITDFLSGSANIGFSNISLRENAGSFNQPVHGAMHLSFNPVLSLHSGSRDNFFYSQQSISVGYHYNFAISGSSYHQLDFRGIFERSIFPGWRVNIRSGAVWKSGDDPLFEGGPQRAQVDILPSRFSARHYAGLSAGIERHIVRFNWVTLSVLGSWQAVFSYGPILGRQFDQGPAGQLRFYINRPNIPPVGIGAAYNIYSRRFRAALSIGIDL